MACDTFVVQSENTLLWALLILEYLFMQPFLKKKKK